MGKDSKKFRLSAGYSHVSTQVGEKAIEVGDDGYETSDPAEIQVLSDLKGVTLDAPAKREEK